MKNKKVSAIALLPFLVFIGVYLITGIVLNARGVEMAFYQLPSPVAAVVGIIAAFIIFKGTIDEKFNSLIKGCGNENIIIMCIIFLLAGAFSTVSKSMGGVDSVVNLGMSVIPAQYISVGIFVISSFIAISTGTSVGTVVAVAPIAIGFAQAAGLNEALVIGATIGGGMFGDNLSIISDTTIAATRTQGVEMKDKFKANFLIALPAAIVTIGLLLVFGRPDVIPPVKAYDYELIKVVPYMFVLIAALCGMNVFVVLTGGIVLSGIIGIAGGSFTTLVFSQQIFEGFKGMLDIFLLSMLMGGLAYMVEKEGGINWILNKIKKVIKGKKTAELGISAMVSITDMATANNTVAILINGPIAKEISEEYKIEPKRAASLLDIFSCVFQGLIPYGAQVLFACASIKGLNSPFDVVYFCWYQGLLAVFALLSIYVPYT
ncbi:MAG: Na+/H+ antiporter NhaC family protein, partial [Peptostreptococcus anaerobius]